VRPHVYAKGRDYGPGSLPERESARAVGAEVVFVGDEKTHAASDMIARLRRMIERDP
jgi:bifunctional ADP-heptose synthase (sugar kinase/adenylyltransferase)